MLWFQLTVEKDSHVNVKSCEFHIIFHLLSFPSSCSNKFAMCRGIKGSWLLFLPYITLCRLPVEFLISLGLKGFPSGSDSKESARNAGDPGLNPGLGRPPGEGTGNPLQYSCLENSMDRRAWWATSPWGCKESDTTEQLTLPLSGLKGVGQKQRKGPGNTVVSWCCDFWIWQVFEARVWCF